MKKIDIQYAAPSLFRPNTYNVNVVSPENEEKIANSLKRSGFYKPILVRQLAGGVLEIIGGEHRWSAAQKLGITEIPYINLGTITDVKAREICLSDNSKFGSDDSIKLAELLSDMDISAAELATFMPYTETDFKSIFATSTISLDDLDLGDEDERPKLPAEKPTQSSQILRFKVPIEDAGWITDLIKRTMKTQKFKDGDELTNAGDSLVHLLGGRNDGL